MTQPRQPQHDSCPAPTRRGLNRVEAAGYIGIGTTLFDELVCDGRMPKPMQIGKRKVWDARAVDQSFTLLSEDRESDHNEWDD